MKELDQLLQQLLHQLESGQRHLVFPQVKPFLDLPFSSLEKWGGERRATIGQILHRIGHAEKALKFLRPFVRGKWAQANQTHPLESLHYGAALIFSGYTKEGERLIEEIDFHQFPMALFYKAIAKFPRWDYLGAKDTLQLFLKKMPPENYFYLVGQLNYASCLVFLRENRQAKDLLLDLKDIFQKKGLTFLQSNLLELQAQNYLRLGQYQECNEVLAQARRLNSDEDSLYRLFIEKWDWVLKIRCGEFSHEDYLRLINKSEFLGHYETRRDLEFHKALYEKNSAILMRLYNGTPYESFREMILKDSQFNPGDFEKTNFIFKKGVFHQFNEHPQTQLSHSPLEKVIQLDRPKRKSERLLHLLTMDFYAPLTFQSLFQELFPGRWYDPESSQNLLDQTFHQLRSYLNEKKLPFVLRVVRGKVFLEVLEDIELVGRENISERGSLGESQAIEFYLEILRKLKQTKRRKKVFQTSDLEKLYPEIPRRTLQRHLSFLTAKKKVQRLGSGRSARYLVFNQ